MQSCATSTTQVPIEVNFYNNGSTSDPYVAREILYDSNLFQYLFYSPDSSSYHNVHLAKINPNGTLEWTLEYSGLIISPNFQLTQMSSDESSIKMITISSSQIAQ